MRRFWSAMHILLMLKYRIRYLLFRVTFSQTEGAADRIPVPLHLTVLRILLQKFIGLSTGNFCWSLRSQFLNSRVGSNWALTESFSAVFQSGMLIWNICWRKCVLDSENFNKIVICLCAMRRKFPAFFQQYGTSNATISATAASVVHSRGTLCDAQFRSKEPPTRILFEILQSAPLRNRKETLKQAINQFIQNAQ